MISTFLTSTLHPCPASHPQVVSLSELFRISLPRSRRVLVRQKDVPLFQSSSTELLTLFLDLTENGEGKSLVDRYDMYQVVSTGKVGV